MNVSGSDHKNKTANKKGKIHTDQKKMELKSFKQAHHTSDIYSMIP